MLTSYANPAMTGTWWLTWAEAVAVSLWYHALHPQGFFRVVETEEGRLAETQHAACKSKHKITNALRKTGQKQEV